MTQKGSQIVYFDREGRSNLSEVIRVVKRAIRRREELRSMKLIIFTSWGEGPALAYNALLDFDNVQIIAVTFPIDFSAKRNGEPVTPRIHDKVRRFFDGVGVKVVPYGPLPLDNIQGMDWHNQQVKTIKDAISIFGGGFIPCIQAAVRACDVGDVAPGE